MTEYLVYLFLLCFLNLLVYYECKQGDTDDNDLTDLAANGGQEPLRTESDYVYWPFASIPFYIDPEHYDHEQSLSIMTALSMFSFKTCLKFAPVLVKPENNQHVLLFENPTGVRQCQFNTIGHSIDEPHRLVLGYDCLKSPQIDMMIMRALGFPFEHNRAIRNIYIDVQPENVEPAYIELFTKDGHLPMQLRALPYDINSVMHFGERDFSKNGHRTIMFKDHKVHQVRNGLTPTDIKKIQIVYGPECVLRDRQEKIELCQNFPGVARKKREIDTPDPTKSLRVNRNITPPKNIIVEEPQSANNSYDAVSKSLTDLGIENEVQLIVDQVNKVSAMALRHAREKFCNNTKPDLRVGPELKKKRVDILGIVESVAEYAQSFVDHAVANLTEFCEHSRSLELYQRQRAKCPFYNAKNCPQTYKSTKSGPVKYSTQHRPLIRQSTKHHGANLARGQYDSMYRARDDDNASVPENATEKNARNKREIHRRQFVVYPLDSDVYVRRKRDIDDSPMSLSEAAVTTPASIESTTTTQNSARKKREIDTQDFNGAPLIRNDMYGLQRRKRDVAESAKPEPDVTTQASITLSTTVAVPLRRKRDVAETTKSEPEVTTQTSTTEGTTEASTATESVATETSVANENNEEKFVAKENNNEKTVPNEKNNEKSVLNENNNETNDKSPVMSEMDVVIVSTDKTGGYVDAEIVSKSDLRMGTRLPRDDSRWAPVDRRHQTTYRRMFRAKYPADARRRGDFETVQWDNAGSDDDQKEIEDAKRVIREDPDLQIILEGNKAKLLEKNKKKEDSESDVPKKKKKERGKTRNEEIEEYQERQKEELEQKKRKKFAEDYEERKIVEKERERNEKRPRKPKRKDVASDDDEESEVKVKKPLKPTKEEVVSSEEAERLNKQKKFKIAKVAKKTKAIQPAIVQDYDEVAKALKKPVPEDVESEDEPKFVKNPARGGPEYDDETKNVKIPAGKGDESDEEPKTVKKSVSKYVEIDDEPKTVKKSASKYVEFDDEPKTDRKPAYVESDDEPKTVKKSAPKDEASDSEPKTVKKPTDDESDDEPKIVKKPAPKDEESDDDPSFVKKPAKDESESDDSKPVKKPAKTKTIDPNQSEKEGDSEEIEVSSRRPTFVPRTVDLTRKNKDFYQDRKWSEGIVPYIIQEDPKYDINDMRRRLAEVNSILKEKTCVQLKEIKPTETNKYEDYLVLDTSPDYVTGRVGGRQNFGVVELFQGGQHRQHAAMMVMAMLGFYFEVSRHDRDKFIRVHQRHVRPDKLHHFEKIRSDATLHLPYDYRSATHPAWQFWRHMGRTGISTVATYKEKDPDGSVMKQLGQNEKLLSDFDLIKINSIYGIKCFTQANTLRRKTKV